MSTFALLASPAPGIAQGTDEGRLFVRGYGGVTFSSANNGTDTWQQDPTFGGGVGWNLSRHFATIGDVSYMRNIATAEGLAAVNTVASLINLVSGLGATVSLDAPTVFVLGGARFSLGSSSRRVRLFAEGQGGIARSSFSLKVSGASGAVVADASQTFKDLLGKTSSTNPAVAAGGGADIRLSRSLAAEAGYHYVRLFGNAKSNMHQVFAGAKVNF